MIWKRKLTIMLIVILIGFILFTGCGSSGGGDSGSATASASGTQSPANSTYISPYSLKFTATALTDDFSQYPRSVLSYQSNNPEFADWYNLAYWNSTNPSIVSQRPWGPTPNLYPSPVVPGNLPSAVTAVEWKRQRVLATAANYIGIQYQHHHIPGWNPPADWPYWKEVTAGVNGIGLDCSNFSSWNYNYGLGIRLNTGIAEQASETSVINSNGTFSAVKLLQATSSNLPVDYSLMQNTLETGDLLYIRGNFQDAPGTNITHVIMWVGKYGQGSSNGVPLIIDSHGDSVTDVNGVNIPSGVYLRPFNNNSWYHEAFDHAHRYLQD